MPFVSRTLYLPPPISISDTPAEAFGVGVRLEPKLAFWSKFASAKAAHALSFSLCLCDYCVLVFLCYWESIN